MDDQNSRPEKDVARIRSIDRVERERGRRRGGKEIDFEAGSAVIPWPSADPLTRVHASTFETKEGRKEAKASLICCMSAGSDAFIMRPPASKRAPVPPLSLSLSLSPPSRRRKTAGCFTWSVSRVSACRVHATRREENTSPLPRVDSNGQWRPSR